MASNVAPAASTAVRPIALVLEMSARDTFAFSDAEKALKAARLATVSVITHDYASASKAELEEALWSAHLKINDYFRRNLEQLVNAGNAKAVERRKLRAEYIKFLKASQEFYHDFIGALNTAYEIPEMCRLSKELGFNKASSRTADPQGPHSSQILASAHRALIQLGDLWRYSTSPLTKVAVNPQYALDFYDLARCIVPSSGVAYNQMSLMAIAKDDHFEAVYCLFRALAASQKHDPASINLKKTYLQISALWGQPESFTDQPDLLIWYLRLISKSSRGVIFEEHDELAQEFSAHLRAELAEDKHEVPVQKIFLINFAACHVASEVFQAEPAVAEHFQAYIYHLEMTLTSICDLLLCLNRSLDNLRQTFTGAPLETDLPMSFMKGLPLLRVSMMWAARNIPVLTNPVIEPIDTLQAVMWEHFALFLSSAVAFFGIEDLPTSSERLEEDLDILAFVPLTSDALEPNEILTPAKNRNAFNLGGKCEAHYRLRCIFKSGVEFALDQKAPMRYNPDLNVFLSNKPATGAEKTIIRTGPKIPAGASHGKEVAPKPTEGTDADDELEFRSCKELLQDAELYSTLEPSESMELSRPGSMGRFTGGPAYGPPFVLSEQVEQARPIYRSVPHPGTGSHIEAAFNTMLPVTPGVSNNFRASMDSNSSTTSSGHYPSTIGPFIPAMGLGNGTFGDPIWGNSPPARPGTSLLFTGGMYPWNESPSQQHVVPDALQMAPVMSSGTDSDFSMTSMGSDHFGGDYFSPI